MQSSRTRTVRLLSEDWHRVAIGIPFHLDAGRHVISPVFGNDFVVADVARSQPAS